MIVCFIVVFEIVKCCVSVIGHVQSIEQITNSFGWIQDSEMLIQLFVFVFFSNNSLSLNHRFWNLKYILQSFYDTDYFGKKSHTKLRRKKFFAQIMCEILLALKPYQLEQLNFFSKIIKTKL